MKKTTAVLSFAFIILIALSGKAQIPNWQWATGTTGTEEERLSKVISDINGNVIVAGTYVDSITLSGTSITTHANVLQIPGLPFLGTDLLIAKYDPIGSLLWVIYPSGIDSNSYSQVIDISTDLSGNIYAILDFTPLEPTSAVVLGTDTIYSSSALIKFDPNGNVLWHDDLNHNEYGKLSIDNSGNVLLCSSLDLGEITRTYDTVTVTNPHPQGDKELVIVKYNSFGHALWARTAGGKYSDGGFTGRISNDSLGNIYISGVFSSDTMFFDATTYLVNTAPATSSITADYFYAKYDNNGNVLWAKSIAYASTGATGFLSNRFRLAVSSSGESVLTGPQKDTTFYIGPYNFSSPGQFVAKMDVNGNPVWATSLGSGFDDPNNIYLDGQGNVYVPGLFRVDSITIGNTVLYNAAPGSSTTDIFIAMLDSAGGFLGAFQEGGDDYEEVMMWVNSNGGLYLGLTSSSNSLTFGNSNFSNANFPIFHFYLAYSTPIITGINSYENNGSFSIYPNPASAQINVRFDIKSAFPSSINILNTLGETVYSVSVADVMNTVIDISSLTSGIYILQVQSNKNVSSSKFIKY